MCICLCVANELLYSDSTNPGLLLKFETVLISWLLRFFLRLRLDTQLWGLCACIVRLFILFMNSKATVDRDRQMSGDLVSNRALFSHWDCFFSTSDYFYTQLPCSLRIFHWSFAAFFFLLAHISKFCSCCCCCVFRFFDVVVRMIRMIIKLILKDTLYVFSLFFCI